ncbi:MAG: bifunctional oligoribonuclease/PAP phosphatase NrnA [Firmicutes bacterium]|nr:bifunctional oligoribonuclease/PAP phosphatase NrnA [Bacillota bacterium]
MTREDFVPVLVDFMGRYDRYLVAGHMNPDGDCIGAATAMALALQSMGKEAFVYFDGPTDGYSEMADLYPTLDLEETCALMDMKPCAFVLLDAADDKRLGKGKELPAKAVDFICIDHHVQDSIYARMTYAEEHSCATCEILYHLFRIAGIPINRRMANALFMGIAFDTGGFRHQNTTSSTYRIAGELIDMGADHKKILNLMFHTHTLKEMKVLGEAYRKAKLYEDGILAVEMTRADFLKSGAGPDEVSGIINRLSETSEALVTLYLRESEDGKIIISLRSKGKTDVAKVARCFGGGGHVLAAGCSLEGPILYAKEELLKAIRAEMQAEG